MQWKFEGQASTLERSLVLRVRTGLESIADSLTVVGGATAPGAKTVVNGAIANLEALRGRLVKSKPLSRKYVSDELHRAIRSIEGAPNFRKVARIVPYSIAPVGRETPSLALPRSPMLVDAVAALRHYVEDHFNAPPALPPAPNALDGVPSPVDYAWEGGKITLGPNAASAPVFPFSNAQRDHAQRLEACLVQAQDLAGDLARRRWQVREDYEIEVSRYVSRLPTDTNSGNILLADAAARTLRDIFEAEMDFLPPPFAARLKSFLQQHIALRPFYPEVDGFYRAVQSGRLEEPLPLDAVDAFVGVVRDHTPVLFTPSVLGAISETASTENAELASAVKTSGSEIIAPPSDPLGRLNPAKAHDFLLAGAINRLWKVFRAGEQVHSAAESWLATYTALSGPVAEILRWIQRFKGH
jgi:hypothetical protein